MAIQLQQLGGPYGIPLSEVCKQTSADTGADRILLVEDLPTDAELTIRELRKSRMPFVWRRVQTEVGMRRALREFHPTLILSDFTLPQFDGLRALEIAHSAVPKTPFIFVSASIGEERAIDALQKGATDYVLKSNLSRLVPAVTRALGTTADVSEESIAVAVPESSALSSWIDGKPRKLEADPCADNDLLARLRAAVANRQFELHYQPKVCVHTRRIEGVEALLRWKDPGSGLVHPSRFLPALESSGLILELGDWILEQIQRDCEFWSQMCLPPVRIAVNISVAQLRQPDFAYRLLQLARPWSNGGCGLDIEITEAALLGESAADIKKLRLLQSAGVRIAVDDFGSGQSSLGRFGELPLDVLKIDPTLVRRLTQDRSARTLISTIVSMAHGLSWTVTAEGVETREQLELLRQIGCDHAQGFLHSAAVSAEEVVPLLRDGKGWLMLPVDLGTLPASWDSAPSGYVNAI